jgi:hypothetical protein
MSNLANMPPLGLKATKAAPNPGYLAKVRELPCCICEAFGETQTSETTAHHVTMERFSQRKTPDEMAIPLCWDHHQGQRGSPKIALHESPETWRGLYGFDFDYTPATQDRILK